MIKTMKKNQFSHFRAGFYCFLIALVFAACTDPITVGSELLSGDRAEVGFNGAIGIDIRTFPEDSLITYNASINEPLQRNLLGQIVDPVFGRTKRSIYILPRLLRNSASGLIQRPPFIAFRDSFSIDSIVVVLPLDTSGFYGQALTNSLDYEVREITQDIDLDIDYTSNVALEVSNEVLTMGSLLARNTRTLLHDTLIIDSLTDFHIRIPLDMSLATRLLNADTSLYENDDIFNDSLLQGLQIDPVAVNNGMLLVNTEGNLNAGINIYYSNDDNSVTSFYPLDIDLTLSNFEFDRTGSQSEMVLAQSLNNDFALLEGTAGLMTEVEILNAEDLRGTVINQAQLEIYLEDLEDYDYGELEPADFLTLYYRHADGRMQVIEDVSSLSTGTSQSTLLFFIGGSLEEDEDNGSSGVYRVNLSVHLQRIVDDVLPPVIYLRVGPTTASPARAIIRGPEAAELPMRLRVAFTEL